MKKHWSKQELQTIWTLHPEETILLGNKHGIQRLLYLLILKYYSLEYYFPSHIQDISAKFINFGALQFGVTICINDVQEFLANKNNYPKYQKQIREFYNTTLFNKSNQTQLQEYLYKLALDTKNEEKLEFEFKSYLKQHKIELPPQNVLSTFIKNALLKVETYLFDFINAKISTTAKNYIDDIILAKNTEEKETQLSFLKQDSGKSNRKSIADEIDKLSIITQLKIDDDFLPSNISPKVLKFYKRKVLSDTPEQIRNKPNNIKYPLIIIYCALKQQELLDNLNEHFINFVHKIKTNANKTEAALNKEISKLNRSIDALYQVAEIVRDNPEHIIQEAIYPIVSREHLDEIIKARQLLKALKGKVQDKLIQSYASHYRKPIFDILLQLDIKSNHTKLLAALELIKKYQHKKSEFYPKDEIVEIDGLITNNDLPFVQITQNNDKLISRKDYEYAIFKLLRDKLKNKSAWVTGAFKYRNPEYDTPQDFEQSREYYYSLINQPQDGNEFVRILQNTLKESILKFDKNLPKNKYVSIITRKNKPWIKLSPLPEQKQPQNLDKLKASIIAKWNIISLLDILKEVDLREQFTECFTSSGNREILSKEDIQRRLILCLFSIGTNTSFNRIASSSTNKVTLEELKYIKRKFINNDDLREAITKIVNGIFRIRNPEIWGESTTACAADSRKFTSWDQNLMTEWHARYHGAGIMIYWHVTKQSICIHSQLKTCSSSEVASMLQGVLNHGTEMNIESQYVDSHGKSEVGFGLTYLLTFDLLPRYANIGPQKIYMPFEALECNNIKEILTRPINWELIATHYNSMIKYAVALKIGTATADSIIRQFSKSNYQHPIYKALVELGKAVKSIFLCRYLDSLELRQEIHSGLNVVENWNSVNDFIFYGKKSEITSNSRDEQEATMLCLHLLQVCLAYVNTLLIQDVLNTSEWKNKLTEEDIRALNPLIYQHINPYGTLELDMNKRIALVEAA